MINLKVYGKSFVMSSNCQSMKKYYGGKKFEINILGKWNNEHLLIFVYRNQGTKWNQNKETFIIFFFTDGTLSNFIFHICEQEGEQGFRSLDLGLYYVK